MAKKRKFPKRKRQFNLHTKEGRLQSEHNQKLFEAFPDKDDRNAYLKAMITELDRMIELCQ
jgi:hypothetical protein